MPAEWSDDGPVPEDTLRARSGRRRAADAEPVVDAALDVIHRAEAALAAQPTAPLLEEPTAPYRLREIPGTGLAVHPIVVSAARFADSTPAGEAHRVLDLYAEIGGNAIEVADTRAGRQEQIVGSWLTTRRFRERTVLMARIGVAGEFAGLRAAAVGAAVDRLRTRLRTDRIDVVVLDAPDRWTSLEETLVALARLVEQGTVGAVAAGSHSADRLMEARVAAGQRGLPRFVAATPVYNALERAPYETALVPVLAAQELGALPRSPLAGGFLAGATVTRGGRRRLADLDPEQASRLSEHRSRRGQRVASAIAAIAAERAVPPAAVAIAWVLTRPHVAASIVGPSAAGEIPALAAAAAVRLSRAEAATIEKAGAV